MFDYDDYSFTLRTNKSCNKFNKGLYLKISIHESRL